MSNISQDKAYILLTMATILKKKMAAKEWTNDKTFRFRNCLLWTGLGRNYFLRAKKHFRETSNRLCKRTA